MPASRAPTGSDAEGEPPFGATSQGRSQWWGAVKLPARRLALPRRRRYPTAGSVGWPQLAWPSPASVRPALCALVGVYGAADSTQPVFILKTQSRGHRQVGTRWVGGRSASAVFSKNRRGGWLLICVIGAFGP